MKFTVEALQDLASLISVETDGRLRMTPIDNGDGTGRIEVARVMRQRPS